MSEGYVYCFSNISMPNILKIGMTERTPIERLNEANSSDTWRPPTPYKIEFAKRVNNPRMKEYMIHKLLSELFIPNPEHKSYVRHINGNTKDNRIENLEWAKRNSGCTGGRPKKL